MYSAILSCNGGKSSVRERNSMTKSGQSGAKPSCSSSVRASHRSRLTHAASGERRAPLGSMNPVEESKPTDRKSTRLNSSHGYISYAVFCLKKKKKIEYLRRVVQIGEKMIGAMTQSAD